MTALMIAAFGMGFLGSIHCIGMCGPIVLCLPRAGGSATLLILSRLVYNLGRVATYGALGAVCGALGQLVALAGFQRTLSIAAGVAVLLVVLLPTRFVQKALPHAIGADLVARIGGWWGRLMARRGFLSLFGIGLLNGFLPCGFLYLGLIAAATTGSIGSAATYMFMFGLGTVPAMLLTSVAAGYISAGVRQKLTRVVPAATVVVAVLLVLRGLSLGIPYISPVLHAPGTMTAEHEPGRCH